MFKNVASQKLTVFAFNTTDNTAKTGDAANITAYVSKDHGALAVLTDTSAAEVDATNAKGYYTFDVAQAETNANALLFTVKSSTANIAVIAVPAMIYTTPPYFSAQSIDSNGRTDVIKVAGTTQTANDIGADVNAILADTNELQTNQGNWATATGFATSGNLDIVNTNVGLVLTDTAEIGVAGAGLTNIGIIATCTNLSNLPSIPVNWLTAAGTASDFGTEIGSAVWASAARTLTANTNLNDLNAAGVAAAVWNAATASYGIAGSYGVLIETNLDAAISSRASPTEVNAEIVDALNVDTYAEPAQGTPAATASLATKINYLHKAWRNKTTQTSTTYNLFNDDSTTVGQKSTTSDDGTTFSKTKVISGA